MNRKTAVAISYIFHPVIFALLTPLLFVYRATGNFWYALKWTGFSGGFLFIMFIVLIFLQKKKFVSNIDISDKKERHIFYSFSLLVALTYFISSIIIKGIFFPLSIVSLGIILGIVIFDIFTYYRKVSIHVAIATACVVSIAILYGIIPFFATIWIVLLVAIARVTLKEHTPKEAIAGMFLGALLPILMYVIGEIII